MASISVFGLGYVGCVGIACLAKLGHRVIGCDVDFNKVSRIAMGLPTIVERDIDEVMMEGFKAYDAEVKAGTYPAEEHTYAIDPEVFKAAIEQ